MEFNDSFEMEFDNIIDNCSKAKDLINYLLKSKKGEKISEDLSEVRKHIETIENHTTYLKRELLDK